MDIIKKIQCEVRRINLKCVIIGAATILFIGIIGALFGGSTKMYSSLILPKLAPSRFIFPIVWIILYILIGGALGAVFCNCEKYKEVNKYKGILLFIIMMIFNVIWSSLFFKAQCFFLAFLTILIILILTFFIIVFFFRVYIIASIAMTIYFLWQLFALYLNFAIMVVN